MKILRALIMMFAVIAFVQAAHSPQVEAQYGGESLQYLGPPAVPRYGCGEFESQIPIEIAGLNTSEVYTLGIIIEDNGPCEVHQWLIYSQVPGRSDFTFWVVPFTAENVTNPLPQFSPLPGTTTSKHIKVGLGDNTPIILAVFDFDYDCATGTVTPTAILPSCSNTGGASGSTTQSEPENWNFLMGPP